MTAKKQILYAGAGTLAFIALLGLIKYFQISSAIAQNQNRKMPPEAVTSVIAKEEAWPQTFFAVGSLAATKGAVLSAERDGTVKAVNFESGSFVEKGAVLIELDSSVEEAELRGAQALLEDVERTLARSKSLRQSNAVSQSDLDSAIAKEREARAAVDALTNTIAHMRIIAPFSGTTGIRRANVGQYLTAGTPLVPIFEMDPLYVNFSLPQQSIGAVSAGNSIEIEIDSFPNEKFKGSISSINPQVDSTTRNIDLQAILPNPGTRLRPGMFAEVTVILPREDRYISIPSSSINYAPYGNTVYIIDRKKGEAGQESATARQQVVKIGPRRGTQIAILEGIKSGEEVITSGTFKIRPGAEVIVNNSVAPLNQDDSKLADT